MKLYFKYFLILLKSQAQYRASFWLLALGQAMAPFSAFAALYFMFSRFGSIKGWSLYEVALCFGIVHLSFTISETCARGFDMFSSLVSKGDFDRILVRPRNTVIQVMGSRFEFNKAGRLAQGVIIFVWALVKLPVSWNIYKAVTIILMLFGGILIFAGIFILSAALCFWTIEGIELTYIFSDGGREISQYPLDIYKKWVKRFLTFVIPYGCVNYFPLMYVLGRVGQDKEFYALTPLSGILFIIPCLFAWNYGVKHYRSSGS